MVAVDGDDVADHARDDDTARALRAVGNYGEVFERNLGRDSPLKIERALSSAKSSGAW